MKLYDLHAMRWQKAETEGRVPWEGLTETQRDRIRERVKRVLAGDVARGACGPGDLVVLEGRWAVGARLEGLSLRDPDVEKWLDDEPQEPPGNWRGQVREVAWSHVYDSLEFGDGCRVHQTTRLFGNAHVGYYNLTNLQVAGLSDQSMLMQWWYVTAESFDDQDEALVREMLEEAKITLHMNDRPQIGHSGWDLFLEPRPLKLCLPPRAYFQVEVGFYGRSAAYRKLDERVLTRDRERTRPRLVVHIEGWQRRGVY